MSVLRVKEKSKHSGERENEVALDPAVIRERTLYLKFRRFFEICPGLHANAKIAILAKNRKNRKHRKSVAIFAILTIFAKIAKIAKNRKTRKNSQKLENTSPPKVLRFLRF